MKMLKKFNFAILAVVLGLGLVFTQSAFKTTGVSYHYKNATATGVSLVTSWEMIDEDTPSFSCDNDDVLPCVIEINGSLQDYLNANPTVNDIKDSSELRTTKAN